MSEMERIAETLEIIAAELERVRVLKEYELGVRVEEAEDGNGPYVPSHTPVEEYEVFGAGVPRVGASPFTTGVL